MSFIKIINISYLFNKLQINLLAKQVAIKEFEVMKTVAFNCLFLSTKNHFLG